VKHKQFSWSEVTVNKTLQQLLDRITTCTLKSHPKSRHCPRASIWPTGKMCWALSDRHSRYPSILQ